MFRSFFQRRGQNDVFENADFCLKGLLRRHGLGPSEVASAARPASGAESEILGCQPFEEQMLSGAAVQNRTKRRKGLIW